MDKIEQKFKEAFEATVDNDDLRYLGSLENIDYFGQFCKATSHDKLYKFLGLNTCMFNTIYQDTDAILIIFSIPNGEDASTKNNADQVMAIVELAEKTFVTVDYIKSKEVKDDRFIYVSLVKKLNNKVEGD